MPRKSSCPECPTHICCLNVRTRTNAYDLDLFEHAGNTLIQHDTLEELNLATGLGLHFFTKGEEVWITMNGFCAAFNFQTGQCSVHDPATLPRSCEVTQERGALCPDI